LADIEGDEELGTLPKPGETYAVYNDRNGGPLTLDLQAAEGQFTVRWFNPRRGGELQEGTVKTVDGGDTRQLGNPPSEADQEWICLVEKHR
jgi:hypothetical protein